MRDPRRAYRVVDDFEAELCSYTGAPFAVAVNSCTNALFLALVHERSTCEYQDFLDEPVLLPRRTYVGVLQSVLNSGSSVKWQDEDYEWQESGSYPLEPWPIWDCARDVTVKGAIWKPEYGPIACLSFHSAKQLPLGRGGAIVTDDEEAAEWFRAARMDGRPPGENRVVFPGYHCPMSPDVAARGLDVLSRWNDKGYSPPPLPYEEYPDLSEFYP